MSQRVRSPAASDQIDDFTDKGANPPSRIYLGHLGRGWRQASSTVESQEDGYCLCHTMEALGTHMPGHVVRPPWTPLNNSGPSVWQLNRIWGRRRVSAISSFLFLTSLIPTLASGCIIQVFEERTEKQGCLFDHFSHWLKVSVYRAMRNSHSLKPMPIHLRSSHVRPVTPDTMLTGWCHIASFFSSC